MVRDRLADLHRRSLQNGMPLPPTVTSNGNGTAHTGGDEVIEIESTNANGNGNTGDNERTKLHDPFFQEVETLQNQLTILKEDVGKIQKLHSFLLLRPVPDQDVQSQVEQLDNKVRLSARRIIDRLKELEGNNGSLESKQPNSTQLRIRETQLSFLHKWYMDLITEHSTSQEDYRTKYKERMIRSLEIVGKVSDLMQNYGLC